MRAGATLANKDETISVQIPLRLHHRGGRKLMVAPNGSSAWLPPRSRVGSAMVKAIARAHRWQGMLEQEAYASNGACRGREDQPILRLPRFATHPASASPRRGDSRWAASI